MIFFFGLFCDGGIRESGIVKWQSFPQWQVKGQRLLQEQILIPRSGCDIYYQFTTFRAVNHEPPLVYGAATVPTTKGCLTLLPPFTVFLCALVLPHMCGKYQSFIRMFMCMWVCVCVCVCLVSVIAASDGSRVQTFQSRARSPVTDTPYRFASFHYFVALSIRVLSLSLSFSLYLSRMLKRNSSETLERKRSCNYGLSSPDERHPEVEKIPILRTLSKNFCAAVHTQKITTYYRIRFGDFIQK